METVLLPTHTPELCDAAVARAAAVLASGEPVALPTETVYGLAADALRPEAVVKIFEAKERPFFDPLIVHLPTPGWLEELAEIPAESRALVAALTERFWPGPLTLVLPRRAVVPDIVTAGLGTVAVRMSAHPVFRAVIGRYGRPLAAPSANRFGRISPTTADHVLAELRGRIGLTVDGGATTHGIESTIVAVEEKTLRLLRSGPITGEELRAFAEVRETTSGSQPEAPGQLASHYAPRTMFHLEERAHIESFLSSRAERKGYLVWQRPPSGIGCEPVEILSPVGDLREAAATLFAKMRRLDDAGLDVIFAESVPEHGLGIAIMDRLRKAAHPK